MDGLAESGSLGFGEHADCGWGAGGGFLEHQHRKEQARIAAAREAEHQRQIEEQRAREAEEELAKVDSEVSREVPHALEPLAQLMTDDNGQ